MELDSLKPSNIPNMQKPGENKFVPGTQKTFSSRSLRYRVLHGYESTHPGDISASGGDLINHVRDLGNGWILGYNISTGQTGTLPAGYINPADPVVDTERDTNDSSNVGSQSTRDVNIPPEESRTGHIMPDSEQKTYQPATDRNVSSFTQRLLKSQANEYRCIKAVLGAIVGVVASAALFILLVFVYDISYEIAGYITLGLSLFIMAGLAMSIYMRCVMLLMLPNLTSSKGRTAFLSLIYGLLLSGPVMNISTNAVQVSESLACATDVIYNQTRALKNQLQEPLIKIAEELQQSFKSIEATANDIKDALEPIESAINSFISASSDAANALAEVSENCKSELRGARDSCESGISSAKSSCEDELNKLDITDDISNAINGIFNKRRRKREFNRHLIHKYFLPTLQEYGTTINRTWKAISNSNSTRHRRGVLSSVCKVLDISSACASLSVVDAVCDPFVYINSALSEAAELVQDITGEFSNFFDVTVNSQFSLSGRINASKTASDIVDKVSDDIKSKTESLTSVLSVVANILGLTLIFLFLTSVYYLRKYLSKDYYDNIYITSEFRRYDKARRMEGKETVLPLRRKEKRKYIVTLSPLPSMKELATAKAGFATVLLHLIITALVIFFNYVLHYILNLVRNYGGVAIISSGVNFADISVSGGGILAKFIKVFVDELDLNVTIESDFNFTVCLPDPSHPSSSDIPVFLFLYFVLLVLLIVQAYGYRIRRKIAAFYFPEQEHARVVYLHEKIRYKRKTILSWLKQVIVSKLRGTEPKNRISLRGMLTYRNLRFGRFLNFCFPPKKGCVSCNVIASSQVKLNKCKEASCKAVYCDECFKVMEDTCLLCETKREVDQRSLS